MLQRCLQRERPNLLKSKFCEQHTNADETISSANDANVPEPCDKAVLFIIRFVINIGRNKTMWPKMLANYGRSWRSSLNTSYIRVWMIAFQKAKFLLLPSPLACSTAVGLIMEPFSAGNQQFIAVPADHPGFASYQHAATPWQQSSIQESMINSTSGPPCSMAVAGFVLCFIGMVIPLCSLLAIIFGAVALGQVRRGSVPYNQHNVPFGITAVVLGSVFLITFIAVISWLASVGFCISGQICHQGYCYCA